MKGSSKIQRQRVTLSSEMANRSLSLAHLYLNGKSSKTDHFGSMSNPKFSIQGFSARTPTQQSIHLDEKKQSKIDNSFCLSSDNFSEESVMSVHYVQKYHVSEESNDEEEQNLNKNKEQKDRNNLNRLAYTENLHKENWLNEQNHNEGDIQLEKIQKKHSKQIQKNPLQDAYYVLLQPINGIERLKYEYDNYHDFGRNLELRKKIFYYLYYVPTIMYTILNSVIFKLFMTTLILFNVGLFIYVKTSNRTDTDHIEQVITILFIIEIAFRILASGMILNSDSFFRSPLNVYDFTLITLTTLNLYRPDIIKTDISPLRMITLLNYLGDILKGLSVMLKALKSSIKFLIEALIIVGLFSLFFGIMGVFLFQGLFNYRCQFENGDEADGWIQCDTDTCPDGMKCLYSDYTPKPPTSFNNIIYALGQILRTITMDDWSWVMFYTMRIYNKWIWIYYLLIIFVGGFFGFNLVIAVLKTHYAEIAEETIQEERKQQIAISLREKQENPERDLVTIFDVAVLKHIGIYRAYQFYKKQLNSALCQSQSNKIQALHDDGLKLQKVRTLSGKQNIKEKGIRKVSFQDKLDDLNLKYFLLPRFQYLDKKKNQLLPSNYTDDPIELELLQRLLKHNFSCLRPTPNYKITHTFSSQEDILLSYIERQNERKMYDQLQMIMKCRKTKFKQIYSLVKINHRKRFTLNQKTILPLRTQKFKQKTTIIDPTVEEETTKPIIIDRQFQTQDQITTKLIYSKGKTSSPISSHPFQVVSKRKIFLRIQEQYIDYEGIAEKINTKIPKMIDNTTSNEFDYGQLRKKELKNKKIIKKNWSGNQVLQTTYLRSQQFNDIKQQLNYQDSKIWLKGIKGKILSAQKYCYIIISSKFSILFFDIIILFNFIFLSLQGIVDPVLISNVEDISAIFLCIELVIILFSYPLKVLITNTTTIMQILIIFVNFIELVFGDDIGTSTDQSLRLIRGTKCLLFYRCLKYNKMANKIGKIANKTFESYIYLTFLMFLVIFMYALIGMEMYAGEFDQNDTLGQLHSFDNIVKSFMTIFNIMTNDDWYGVYVMGGYIDYTFSVIYSYSMVIILNYLTYGLVIAILLDGFGKYLGEEEEIIAQDEVKQILQTVNSEIHDINFDFTQQLDSSQISNQKNKINLIQNLMIQVKQIYNKIQEKNSSIYKDIHCQQSLFIFDKQNIFRTIITQIVLNRFYKYLIDLTIYFSVIVFILKTYHDYEVDSSELPDKLLFITNLVILLDFCLNIIAKGFFLDQGAFLQSTWQIIDIIYIISFIIARLSPHKNYPPIIDILIYLGYFRPMKLMYRIDQLTQLRAALGQALFDIINVLITLLSVWLVFGVYGIILYEKQFGYCEDKMEFYLSETDCLRENRTWVTYKHNFDNITTAIPTLFVVSTFDGWGEILQVAENSYTSNRGPIPFNSYIYTYVYLIIFCFIGSMFFLSLFTGVLFTSLKENQLKMENNDLTQNQKEFIKITNILMFDFPIYSEPPKTRIRQIASNVVNDPKVQIVIYTLLILDLIILLLIDSNMSITFFNVINNLHNILTIIYLLWIILLFFALGINRYFDNNWRRFYVFLIFISIIDFITHYSIGWTEIYFDSSPTTQYYQILRFFFSLRSLRIILIFQGMTNIQRLIRVMAFAVPYLVKIFTILIITMIIFSLFGCNLYGKIESGAVMDDLINFQSFGNAMLALYKCASGDDWRTIMTDTMQHNPLCQDDPNYCGSSINQIYFILFMLLSNYVLLNLFVLGLIEQFEQFFQMQNSQIQTYVENIDKIKTVWCKYSSDTQGHSMHYKYLCKFLLDIGSPLGLDSDSNLWDACKFTSGLKLQSDVYGHIQYNLLMYELFRKCFYDQVFKQGDDESIKKIKQFHKKSQFRLIYFRKDKNLPRSNISSSIISTPNVNILHDYLNVLVLFKTWEQYSKILIEKLNEEDHFSDDSINPAIVSVVNQNKVGSYQQSQIHILHENEIGTLKDVEQESIIEWKEHRISLNTQLQDQYNDLPLYRGTYETSLQSENRDHTFLRPERQFESEI